MIKKFLFVIIGVSFLGNISFAQNRLNSRLFHTKPPLFYSPSQIKNLDLSGFAIYVEEPVDHRSDFYGEVVYKKKKVQQLDEFFEKPTMIGIQQKIKYDLSLLGASDSTDTVRNEIIITPVVEVFYPDVRGFFWVKSFAKVRLVMIAKLANKELINKKYEYFYITDGTDKEFEGSVVMTIEQCGNVTIGMALRKVLDEFYNDLYNELNATTNEAGL